MQMISYDICLQTVVCTFAAGEAPRSGAQFDGLSWGSQSHRGGDPPGCTHRSNDHGPIMTLSHDDIYGKSMDILHKDLHK